MSATTTALTDATADLETAMAGLATAYLAYQSAFAAATSAVYTDAGGGSNGVARKADLENTIGMSRLDFIIASRLAELGMKQMFTNPQPVSIPAAGTSGWRTWLDGRIQAMVA